MGEAPSIADRERPSAGRAAAAAHGAVERWLEDERDQLALWLPVALGAGVAAWFTLPAARDWVAAALAALALAAVALGFGSASRVGRALGSAGIAVALGIGLIWWRAEAVRAPVLPRTVVATLTAHVVTVEPQPARQRTRLTVTPLTTDQPLPPRLRVNVDDDAMVAGIAAGTTVRLRARLLPPAPAAVPGGYDFAETAWFDRVGATGKALDRPVVLAGARGEGGLRARLTAHIEDRLPGSEGGIAAAFVTGDEGAIDPADADAMRRSGLAHLLSISGLHVTAVIAATILLVTRTLALSPRLALNWPLPLIGAAAGGAAGIGYTLLSGSQVPTVRSCVAALLVIAGLAIGREALTLRLVAAGALLVIAAWPESVAGPSFQLSFAAVTTIIAFHEHPRVRAWFGKREERWWRQVSRELGSLVATGLAVEAALAPIALYHFQKAGLYGAVANIVAIPLTTFVIMPLEALALLLDTGGLGAPLWWLAGRALALLLGLAHVVGSAPGAQAMLPSMPGGAYALIVAGGLWLLLWRTHVRRLGLALLLPGLAWALATPPPDLPVTGDGKHLALRTADGRLALLRDRAGDYVRGLLGEAAGIAGEPQPIDDLPGARCGADLCAVAVATPSGVRHLLATRSPYRIDTAALAAACTRADIVVSDRRLPRACAPRWLKADATLLARTGGLAIRFSPLSATTVREPGDEHPWVAEPAPDPRRRRYMRASAEGSPAVGTAPAQ